MASPRGIFIALLGVGVLQVLFFYPLLPETMASHFNGAGRPNGWSTKTSFMAIDLAMMGIMALSFLVLPTSLGSFRRRFVSLPNKDYWFAPERRRDTERYFKNQMLGFGAVTMVLLICTMQLAIDANLNPPPMLSSAVFWFLVGYLAYTVVWTVRLITRFTRIPDHPLARQP